MSLRALHSPYALGEIFARAIQWVLPLLLGLLMSQDDLSSAILYLSWHAILSGIVTLGQDKWILKTFNKKYYVIACYSVLITLSIVWCFFMFGGGTYLSFPFSENISLFIAVILGGAFQRLNVAVLRSENAPRQYLLFRITINTVRLLLFLIAGFKYGSVGILGFIVADCVILSLSLSVFYKFDVSNFFNPNSGSIPILCQSINFGLSVFLSVLFSNLSIHFGRIYLGNKDDASLLSIYTISYVLGASISFAFSAIAVQSEPNVYKSSTIDEAKFQAQRVRQLMLKAWLVFSPVVIFFAFIYISFANVKIDYLILSGTLISFLFAPIWHQNSYIIVFIEKHKYLTVFSFLAVGINVLITVLLFEKLGVYSLVLAGILSNALLAILGSVYVKQYR